MEFKSLKNIETSFKQIRLFGIVFVVMCTLITGYAVWNSYTFAEAQRQKIYVLDGGKSLMLALSQDLTQNRPVEAREHVKRFHELFSRSHRIRTLSKAISNGRCSSPTRAHLIITVTSRKRILQPYHFGQYQPNHTDRQRFMQFRCVPVCGGYLCPANDYP